VLRVRAGPQHRNARPSKSSKSRPSPGLALAAGECAHSRGEIPIVLTLKCLMSARACGGPAYGWLSLNAPPHRIAAEPQLSLVR